MALHDPTTDEAREQLDELIAARTTATEIDILVGRAATLSAITELCGSRQGELSLGCDGDEADALVRAAVVGRSALVGTRIAEIVQYAIYIHVLPLAKADLADMARGRREQADEARIDRALDARAAA